MSSFGGCGGEHSWLRRGFEEMRPGVCTACMMGMLDILVMLREARPEKLTV